MAKNGGRAFVKNATIATLTALLLLCGGFSIKDASANTLDAENSATTETIVYQDKIVEVEKEVVVEIPVEVPVETIVEVEKIVEVPVETIVYQDKIVEVEKEVINTVDHRYEIIGTVANGDGTYNVTFDCTAEGCNDRYTVTIGEKVEVHTHNYEVVNVKEATCETDGVETHACTCGSTYTTNIKATGHQFGEWVETSEATTDANKEETRSCSACGKEETREVEGTKIHVCDFVESTHEDATCEENGSICYVCACGKEKMEEIPATGHNFCEWHKTFDLRSEVESRECEYCGKQETRETEVHVHDYKVVLNTAVEATCDNEGKEADIACECGDVITGATLPALGHDYEVVSGTSKEATCTENGKVSDKKCTHCGDVITGETINATGHDYKVVVDTEATCTENGCHSEKCENCGDTVETHKDAIGHAWGEYVYNNDATELEDGTETRRCENCGEQQTKVAEGTKIYVNWKELTYISIDEFHWGYYTDDNGVLQCGSVENCKQYLAEKYPFLTVYEDANGVWAE